MSNEYIQIYTPTESNSYKFGAIAGQWSRIFDKAITIARTIGGGLDIAMGSVYQTDQMVIKVRADEDRAGYGTRQNLEDLYKYNRPGANVLRVTDHYGNTLYTKFTGRFNQRSITTTIEGDQAWYHIPIELTILPDYFRKLMALAPDDIVALIPLWDPSGVVLSDIGGNEYDVIPDASVILDQDGIGDGRRSVYMDETVIDISAIEPGLDYTEGTLFLWAKPPSGGFISAIQYFFNIVVDGNNFMRIHSSAGGNLLCTMFHGGIGNVETYVSPPEGWQVLAVAWGGGDARFYRGGSIVGSPITIGTWVGSAVSLFLGASSVVSALPLQEVNLAYFCAFSKKFDATEIAVINNFTR